MQTNNILKLVGTPTGAKKSGREIETKLIQKPIKLYIYIIEKPVCKSLQTTWSSCRFDQLFKHRWASVLRRHFLASSGGPKLLQSVKIG